MAPARQDRIGSLRRPGQILEELRQWQTKLGEPLPQAAESDPRKLLAKTLTYFQNNRWRMNYPQCRRQGLLVTTAWMESLVKEMNYRVKGSKMFWNDPDGAEAILQVRGASLSQHDRLSQHLCHRPSCAFTRRPKPPKAPAKTCKS